MLLPLPLPKGEDKGEGFSSSRLSSFQWSKPIFRLLTLALSSLEEERRPFQRAPVPKPKPVAKDVPHRFA